MNLPCKLIAAIALLVWGCTYNGHAQQFYDATIGGQCRDVAGSVRCHIAYHAYPWEADSRILPSIEAAASCCCEVQADYEPEAAGKGSTDPHEATFAQVAALHQSYATGLSKVIPRAKELNVRLGIWTFVSLHARSGEITNPLESAKYKLWRAEQDAVLKIPVEVDGKVTTLVAMVNETGGAVWIPAYVPNAWNVPDPKVQDRMVLWVDRVATALEEGGCKVIPAIMPLSKNNVGNPVEVLPELNRKLIQHLRKRHGSEWCVWARSGEVTPEFKALLREELTR